MSAKRARSAAPAQPSSAAQDGSPHVEADAGGWRSFLLTNLFGLAIGPFVRLIAALLLGLAIVFLTAAWQNGPQRVIDGAHYAKLTARVDGRIVESWLAIEFDPAGIRAGQRWRAFAKATPCAVVAYAGDWGATARRAFCGNRFGFNESYTLHDLSETAPRVPFAWARDAQGFVVPEIRLGKSAHDWLAAHAPTDTFMLSKPPPATELAALEVTLDKPIEYALAGWTAAAPTLPLALDPQQPDDALPAGFVERYVPPNWFAFALLLPFALALWWQGMAILLGGMPRNAALFAAILPLLALPWWGERIPVALRHLDAEVADVIADMLGDLDPTGRLVASEPARATLVDGERVLWHAGGGVYAETFGRLHFAPPSRSFANGDLALAALVDQVTGQVNALDAAQRTTLFAHLEADKLVGLREAGLVFLPAAKQALLDPYGDAALQLAAKRFLSEWVVQPIEEPYARAVGYEERVNLFRGLTDVPVPEIAIPATQVVERAAHP